MAPDNFQHILRVMNTNIDGKVKCQYALTKIKGIGRRFSNLVLKKAEVSLNKRAGELTPEELEKFIVITQNPRQFKIPDYFLNRKKDHKDGRYTQLTSNLVDMKVFCVLFKAMFSCVSCPSFVSNVCSHHNRKFLIFTIQYNTIVPRGY